MLRKSLGIIYNPISGKGQSKSSAEDLLKFLDSNNYQVRCLESKSSYNEHELDQFLNPLDVVIVLGGDGTLLTLLNSLIKTQTPIFMYPTGNESLFAKEFGMRRDKELLLRTLRAGVVSQHFVPTVNASPFFTMCSIGFDSHVISLIAKYRDGPLGHKGYVKPTLRAMTSHKSPKLTVDIDGQTIVSDTHGFLIVSNTKQYALNLLYVPEASSSKQKLSGRFLPYDSVWDYGRWVASCRLGRLTTNPSALFFEGEKISVSGESGFPVQADGDLIGHTPAVLEARGNTIQVLEP